MTRSAKSSRPAHRANNSSKRSTDSAHRRSVAVINWLFWLLRLPASPRRNLPHWKPRLESHVVKLAGIAPYPKPAFRSEGGLPARGLQQGTAYVRAYMALRCLLQSRKAMQLIAPQFSAFCAQLLRCPSNSPVDNAAGSFVSLTTRLAK